MKNILTTLFTFATLLTPFTSNAQAEHFVIDTIGHSDRHLYDSSNKSGGGQTWLPYPIIFIHGLGGDWYSWGELGDMLYDAGYAYGGRLEYCLNSDGSDYFVNPSTDITPFLPQNLSAADFYDINFNCNSDGSCFNGTTQNSVLSNQSAVVKQGIALSHAIEAVINATGRNKVILMGHSMGGLCAREYLQNSNLWYDGNHRVAKLITSGTPHGGSDATFANIIPGTDEQSEAVRDLREEYFASGYDGAYLYGSIEDDFYISNSLLWDYYNVDVNCNGAEEDNIVGLNQKNLPYNLDFSIIWSDYNILLNGGDGVVDDENADLSNYYPNIPNYEKFKCLDTDNDGSSNFNHIEMPEDLWTDMRGLDEPDDYHLSYEVEVGVTYRGTVTLQGVNSNYTDDYDDFILDIDESGTLSVNAVNLESGWSVSLYDVINENYLQTQVSTGTTNTSIQTLQVSAGQYIIEIYGTPYYESWMQPYSFTTIFNPDITTDIEAPLSNLELTIYPNPSAGTFNVSTSSNLSSASFLVFNTLGQVIVNGALESSTQIDLSSQVDGFYILKVQDRESIITRQLIKTSY
jgi:pimeloyl-ACP methyl ester carboxylesterase